MEYIYGGIIGAAIVVAIDVVVYIYRARLRSIAAKLEAAKNAL